MGCMSMPHRISMVAAALAVTALAGVVTGCTSSAGTSASSSPAPAGSGGGGSTGGSGGSPGAGSPQRATGPIVPPASTLNSLGWQDCTGALKGMKCASIQVPLDYANPAGQKITIALSMVPATAPASQQQGIMLVNPGGPGAPGRSLASLVAQSIDPKVASEYDIVGFDPRGVGGSVPALSCDPSFFATARPDYDPTSPAEEQAMINRAKDYAAGCEQRFGWLLPYMRTQDAARDMDSIRAAFGVSKITYYAFSYGTYLGQVYGTLFPSRVRRMVLDSTVDPAGVWYADNIQQDYAFEGRMNAFFAWTARNNSTFGLGATAESVRKAWYEARGRLEASPVSVGGQPQIGPDEFDDTFLQGGYGNYLWPTLARALSNYLH